MTEGSRSRRFFSEKEIGTVLRRATELQEASKSTDPTGLTFEELQQIAAEAGIDPRYLSQAVASLDEEDTDDQFHWMGAPLTVNLERVVEGEVSEQGWSEMVDDIRSRLDLVGSTGRVGQSREWTYESKEQQAQVTVTSREGQTKIRIFAKYPQLAASVFAPALGLGVLPVVAILANMTPWIGIPVLIAVLGTVAMGLRFLFSRLMRAKKRKAQELLDRLELRVSEPVDNTSQALPEQNTQQNAALLDIDERIEEIPAQPISRTKTSS